MFPALLIGGAPQGGPPPPVLYNSKELASFSTANYYSAPEATFPAFTAGSATYGFVFRWTAPSPVAYRGLYGCHNVANAAWTTAGSRGFQLEFNAAGQVFYFFFLNNGALNVLSLTLAPACGLNCLVITNTAGGHVHASLNGAAAVDCGATPAFLAPNGTCTQYLGYNNDASSGVAPGSWNGTIFEFVAWNTSFTDADLALCSNCTLMTGNSTVVPPVQRMSMPAAYTGLASVVSWWNAARDGTVVGNSVSGAGSAPITWAVQGAPTLPAYNEAYIATLQSSFVDTATPDFNATDKSWHTSPGAGLILDTAVANQQVFYSYLNDNNVGSAGDCAPAWNIDGGAYTTAPAVAPFQPAPSLVPVQLGTYTAAQTTHVVRFDAGPIVSTSPPNGPPTVGGRICGILAAVSQTIDTSAPAAQYAVNYGDSTSEGFTLTTASSQGYVAQLRVATGTTRRIQVEAYGGRLLFNDCPNAGAASGFAAYLKGQINQYGTGITRSAVLWIGINDYLNAPWTAVAWAVQYQNLINDIAALDGTIAIYVMNLAQSHYNAIPNGQGDTLATYNAAITALTGKTLINIVAAAPAVGGDNIHYTAGGYTTIEGVVKAALGW